MQTQTVNISLPRPLLQQVDLMAKQVYSTRSDLIRQALLEKIRRWQEWENIFSFGQKQAKKLGIKSEQEADKIVYEFRHGSKVS